MGAASTISGLGRLTTSIAGSVARIELRYPPLNIIDVPMMEELAQVLSQIESRSDISVIVFGGEGKAFSAGVDVAAHTPDKVEDMLAKFHGVIRALVATKRVTMVCDIVYTTEDAQWGCPEIKLGCYPPVACAALAALVGQKRSAELILTGRTISGREAAQIGLATDAVGDPEAAVQECLSNLLQLSPAALSVTKKALYAWDSIHFDKGLARAEKTYFDDLMKPSDAHEGIRAFMEKRPPKWTGR
jgi:enoyl-CoA hydratase/carnithine racemase